MLRPISRQTAIATSWNGAGQTDWELKKRVVISPPKKDVNVTKNPVLCPRCNAELNKKNLAKHLRKHDEYRELWPEKKDDFKITFCCLLCHNQKSKIDDFGRFIGNIDKHLAEEHDVKSADKVINTYYSVLKSKLRSKSKNVTADKHQKSKKVQTTETKIVIRKRKVFVVKSGKAIRPD